MLLPTIERFQQSKYIENTYSNRYHMEVSMQVNEF